MSFRTILFVAAALILLGLAVGGFMLTRPAPIADHTPPPVDPAAVALAGWRESADGAVLVLPAPDGGVEVRQQGETWLESRRASADMASWPLVAEAPYQVIATSAQAPDGVHIAATLFVPANPRAGAVIIHGSGDSTRSNAWYLDFIDYFARRGVAVWFPDKRGAGASGGRWQDASFHLLAQDAVAGRAALEAALAGEGAAPPIGYVGVSQGGWVAPLAAQLAPAAFVVIMSAAAVTPNEQLDHEVRANLQRDLPGFLVPVAMPIARATPRWRHPEFWRANGDLDPAAEIAASATPTLVALGAEDEFDNVPVVRSVAVYEAAAAGAPLEVIVVAGGGHDLSPGEGLGPTHRPTLDRMVDFMLAQGADAHPTGDPPARERR